MSLKRQERIRKGYEFKRAFDEGKVFADELFKAFIVPSEKTTARLGVLTSRKVGAAVQRNRIRRLFREAFRSLYPEIKRPMDLVILPRAKAKDFRRQEIEARLKKILLKSGTI